MASATPPPRLALLALGLSGALQAQSPEEDRILQALRALMDTPVITATRTVQGAAGAPATVVVVSRDLIRRRGYRSLLEVLQDLPDFKVDVRGHWDYLNDVTVRGVTGHDRLLILLDGTRISGPTNEPIPILENYPVHLVQQIEVVYGPASALYGADAVSGVINLITRTSEGGEALLRLGDHRQRFGNLYWGGRVPGGARVTLAGQWLEDPLPDLSKDWPDYHGFAGQRTNRYDTIFGPRSAPVPFDPTPSYGNKAGALYAALAWEGLSLSIFHNVATYPSATVDTPDNAVYAADVFLRPRLTVLGGRYAQQTPTWAWETRFSASDFELDPHSNYANVFTEFRKGYQFASSQAYRAEQQLQWSPGPRLSLSFGGVYEVFHALPWTTNTEAPVDPSHVQGRMLGVPIEAKFYALRFSNFGGYAQAQWSPHEALQLTFGARQDRNSRFGSAFNPRLGLVWKVLGGRLKALYGTAFLAPSPYTAFKYFGAFHPAVINGVPTYESDFMQLPNPDLRPIRSRTYELGYQRQLGSRMVVSASLYQTTQTDIYTDVSDLSSVRIYNGTFLGFPVKTIFVNANLGRARIRGGNLRLDYAQGLGSGTLRTYCSYSAVDGRVDELGDGREIELDHVSPSSGCLGVQLEGESWSVDARLNLLGPQRLTALRPGTDRRHTLDGYRDLRLQIRYQVSGSFEAQATVTNAFNSRYRNINANADPAGNQSFLGVPQEPRRLSLGLRATF